MTAFIVFGAALLLSATILLPAEKQISKNYRRQTVDEYHPPHSRKAHRRTLALLERVMTFGFSLLVLYLFLEDADLLNTLFTALSLK